MKGHEMWNPFSKSGTKIKHPSKPVPDVKFKVLGGGVVEMHPDVTREDIELHNEWSDILNPILDKINSGGAPTQDEIDAINFAYSGVINGGMYYDQEREQYCALPHEDATDHHERVQ